MNSAPNQSNNTFNTQQPGTQTNPFNDMKGEFSSNFGGASNFGTNAGATNVSQIFKDVSTGNEGNKRAMIYGGLGLVVVAFLAWMYLGTSEDVEEMPVDDMAAEEGEEAAPAETPAAPVTDPAKPDAAAQPDAMAQQPAAGATEAPAADPAAMATGPIQLATPDNGASLAYDETQGSASFSWTGGPGTIVFSRNSSMQPEVMRVKVSGTSYSFHRPWPGQWFWKVESEGGASEVRSFSVQAPVRRNVSLTAPAAGSAIAGSGGAVTWTGDSGVAYYRVELNQSEDWSNPMFKFSSSGTQLQLNGVPAGQYSMRLGAFSEVSGRWEYTQPISVTVQ